MNRYAYLWIMCTVVTKPIQSAPLNKVIKAAYMACAASGLYGSAWYADKMNQHFFFQSPEQFRSLKKLMSVQGPAQSAVENVAQKMNFPTENLAVDTHEDGDPVTAKRVASINIISVRKDLIANPHSTLQGVIARELIRLKNNELEKEYAAKIALATISLGISLHPRLKGAIRGLWSGNDNLMSCARIALGYQVGSMISTRSTLHATKQSFETVAREEITTSFGESVQAPGERADHIRQLRSKEKSPS